jgi:hypothetical protein
MTYRALVLVGLITALGGIAAGDGVGAADAPSLANPLAAQALDSLTATRERPLFSPSRRPPPPPPAAVQRTAPKPIDPPRIVLLGIVTEGGEARAVLRAGSSSKVVRARLGDDVGSWTVTQIEPRRLTLSHDDRTVTYALFAGNSAKNAAQRPPPAAAEVPVQTVAESRTNRRSGQRRER